jgi:hypothetical protein
MFPDPSASWEELRGLLAHFSLLEEANRVEHTLHGWLFSGTEGVSGCGGWAAGVASAASAAGCGWIGRKFCVKVCRVPVVGYMANGCVGTV